MLPSYFLLCLIAGSILAAGPYKPTWTSINTHPLPQWYDDSKIGIMCHWGVYSVIGKDAWFWWDWKGDQNHDYIAYAEKNFPGKSYAEIASEFTALHFNATNFADIVKSSGAKYFVFTSKHHDGFTMYPSKTSFSWNSVDLGPKRDIVGELKHAFNKTDVHFGLYFSHFAWFHPLYIQDNTTRKGDAYVQQVSLPQLHEIVNNYEPEIIWSDGEWQRSSSYWKATEFLAWLYNDSPVKNTVIVNDRWGSGSLGKNGGGFFTFADQYVASKLIAHKWESSIPIDNSEASWGYNEDSPESSYLSDADIIRAVASTIALNGNILLNIGPNKDGIILPIFQERLRNLGNFVRVHEEAIYKSKPWIYQFEKHKQIYYTSKVRNDSTLDPARPYNEQTKDNTIIYAWNLNYPEKEEVILNHVHVTEKTKATLLGTNITLPVVTNNKGVIINLRAVPIKMYPSKIAFIIKIEYAESDRHNPLE